MMDVGLADRLRDWLNPIGVTVVEIDGWQQRGRTYASFAPQGAVNHHTAGGPNGVAPSLGIVINGRSDLPGPLCNAHQQRDDVVNVVAAGVANHAGAGGWQGLRGNQTVHGLEVEHVGSDAEDFPLRRFDISARVHAAFLSGTTGNPDLLCEHYEWTPQKIDFWHQPGDVLRNRVRELLAVGPGLPAPHVPKPQPTEEDVKDLLLVQIKNGGQLVVNTRTGKQHNPGEQGVDNVGAYQRIGVPMLVDISEAELERLLADCKS